MMSFRRVYAIFERNIILWFSMPSLILSSILSPLIYFAVFSIALSSLAEIPAPLYGNITYINFAFAGYLVMSVLLGAFLGSNYVYFDARFGMLKEIFQTPLKESEYTFGTYLASVFKALVSTFPVLIFGAIVCPNIPYAFHIWIFVLTEIVVFAMIFASISILLVSFVRGDEEYNLLFNISIPFIFTFSNIYYPLEALPQPMRWIASLNPISYMCRLVRRTMFICISCIINEFVVLVFFALLISLLGNRLFEIRIRRLRVEKSF